MLNLVVGLGVQGKKRIKYLKEEFITVDPENEKADFKKLSEVPLNKITHAYVCTPESQKFKIIRNLLLNSTHVLTEKPLIFSKKQEVEILRILSLKKSTLYTAYNHRFEPHIVEANQYIKKNKLGKIYAVNLYYGNGTAALWNGNWRETNNYSIIHDLGVHLLDIFHYWFGFFPKKYTTNFKIKNELKCFDFFSFSSKQKFLSNFTTSIIDWKNSFKADIIGSKGSLHINCLCKWGPSKLIYRVRKFPSGKPKEKTYILSKKDPTWRLEELYFKKICKKKSTNFHNDLEIKKSIKKIR